MRKYWFSWCFEAVGGVVKRISIAPRGAQFNAAALQVKSLPPGQIARELASLCGAGHRP